MARPRVSVIVTTRNNSATIQACLASIASQTYEDMELIVVDNGSTDDTLEIANKYTKLVYEHGPERSAQRNYGVEKATGEYVLIIDSDMELPVDLVEECVRAVTEAAQAVIIPELSFGIGYWAKCKALERSFYDGVDWIEAPRFFSKDLYLQVGGYDEEMSGGEDWDLSSRVRKASKVIRVEPRIRHNEGRLTFKSIVGKRGYYMKGFDRLYDKPSAAPRSKVGQVFGTYGLFFAKPGVFFRQPIVGVGTVVMKTAEFGVLGYSYIFKNYTSSRRKLAKP